MVFFRWGKGRGHPHGPPGTLADHEIVITIVKKRLYMSPADGNIILLELIWRKYGLTQRRAGTRRNVPTEPATGNNAGGNMGPSLIVDLP